VVQAAASGTIPAGLSREQLAEMYYYLRLTRSLDERLSNLYRQGKVIGGLYSSLGQEGESVASAYALGPGDLLSPLIRNLGSMLVRGAQPVEILRQYMAKATSPTAGREMNVHFHDLRQGYLGQISHLGDMVPVVAGIALSFKLRRQARVCLVYVGDGATSTGAFHEGVAFAAARGVPLVIVLEHNGYAYSTPTARQTAVARLADKAKAYGIPGRTVDGNDVLAVYEASKEYVERARGGGGPAVLEVVTYRRRGHAQHDDQRYQPKDEIAAWERNDPIERFVRHITERGWLSEDDRRAIDGRVEAQLDRAIAESEHDPLPDAGSGLSGVYLDPPTSEPLWFRSLHA
jgi:pyruvate dehydrogenase E1 component alpha subunit/2-oxoisovalerate dehydrogenase E1 component alpha subunit